MGIKDLNKFLKKEVPSVFRTTEAVLFKHTRICIDSNLILYKYFSKAYSNIISSHLNSKEDILNYDSNSFFLRDDMFLYKKVLSEVISKIIQLITFFLKRNEILPIFIFDGKCIKEKEDYARVKRCSNLNNQKENIKENIKDFDTNKKISLETIKKKIQNVPPINKLNEINDFLIIKLFIRNILKLPLLISQDEGEKFCSYLTKIGFCSAVYTTDTDCFAFGAPLIINEINYIRNEFKICQTSVIYKHLEITHNDFVDFCILLGCDFNEKIKGLGHITLWKIIEKNNLLQKNSLIDSLKDIYSDKNFEIINLERCREIFLCFKDNSEFFDINKEKIFKNYSESKIEKHLKDKMILINFLKDKKHSFFWNRDDFKNIEFIEF